ncbi:hypothetical protein SFRURICE_017873 [Spodoptera frugiperda]|nr:hypothetical protein SFRURICE_017873 [Spodoptera frugiperda]
MMDLLVYLYLLPSLERLSGAADYLTGLPGLRLESPLFFIYSTLLSYRRNIWSFSREKLNWTKEDKGLWRTLSTSPSYIL